MYWLTFMNNSGVDSASCIAEARTQMTPQSLVFLSIYTLSLLLFECQHQRASPMLLGTTAASSSN